jgi:hypothetical protein
LYDARTGDGQLNIRNERKLFFLPLAVSLRLKMTSAIRSFLSDYAGA